MTMKRYMGNFQDEFNNDGMNIYGTC